MKMTRDLILPETVMGSMAARIVESAEDVERGIRSVSPLDLDMHRVVAMGKLAATTIQLHAIARRIERENRVVRGGRF